MARPKSSPTKQRFAGGAKGLVKMPGVPGVVTQWHTVSTEHGERRERGCNLELVPTPKTNAGSSPAQGPTEIHIGHMENSAFIQARAGLKNPWEKSRIGSIPIPGITFLPVLSEVPHAALQPTRAAVLFVPIGWQVYRIGLRSGGYLMEFVGGAAIAAVSIILGLVLKPYLTSYSTKKGENLATHEDIEQLVDQVKAVTRATQEIETKISGELWDKQKQWELKRDVLFEATKRVSAVFEKLNGLNSFLQTETQHPENKDLLSWKQDKIDENKRWFEALGALEESRLLVGLTCGKEVEEAITEYRGLAGTVAFKINKDDAKIFRESTKELLRLRDAVRAAIRKELGIR